VFHPMNLDRYRKLASGTVDDVERHQIMDDLAKKINAFRREARIAAVAGLRPFDEDIGSEGG